MAPLTPDQAIDQLQKLPEDQQRVVLGKVPPETRQAILSEVQMRGFAKKPPGQESMGTYQMVSPTGKVQPIPFSNVLNAGKAGFSIVPNDFTRFTKDYIATTPAAQRVDQFLSPSDESTWKGKGLNIFKGTASGLVAPVMHPKQTAVSMGEPLVASGMSSEGAYPATAPLGFGKTGQESEKLNQQVQQGAQADMAAQGQAAREHPVYTAASVVGPAVVMEGAMKIAPKIPLIRSIGDLPGLPRKWAEDLVSHTGTKRMVQKTLEDNRLAEAAATKANLEAEQKHLEDTQDALAKTREGEDLHTRDEENARIEAKKKSNQQRIDALEHNTRVHEKASAGYRKNLEEVRRKNAVVQEKYAQEKQRIEDENKAAEHMLEMRRQAEGDLTQKTQQYFSEEKVVKGDAKKIENTAWDDWRKATNASTVNVDMAPVLKVVEEQITKTPEAANILRNVEVQDGALDPDTQNYLNVRNEVMKNLGYGDDYEGLSPAKQDDVDELTNRKVTRSTPTANMTEVKTMTLEQIHAIKSNIGFKRFNRTYPPDLRYAMSEIYDALSDLEKTESIKLGGGKELSNAKEMTQQYQKAFGRKPYEPTTEADLREREVNPDAYKERKEQERLDNAKVWSQKLVKDYQAVKEAHAAVKKLPTEEKLRGTHQQIDRPPEVDDLRSGYRLEEEPTYEPPTVDDLREGYRLKPMPEPVEPTQIPPPPRAEFPDRPIEVKPDYPGGLVKSAQDAKEAAVSRGENWVRYRGAWIATSAVVGSGLIFRLVKWGISGAAEEVAAGITALVVTNKMADLLEHPNVVKWLTKPNETDMKLIEKLPAAQRKELADAWIPQLRKIEKAGVPVNAAIFSALTGSASPKPSEKKPKSLDEIRKEAEERNPSTPGPQSSTLPYTHVYNEKTGTIVAA